MKRIIKNNLLGFILGAIIFGSIGVIAANYAADTIDYTTNKNNEVKTVKDALDDLYAKENNPIDDIVIMSSSSYTTTQSYSKAYIIVTRLSTPEFQRDGISISPIKTGTHADYYMSVYEINNINPNENWTSYGTTQLFFIE